MLQSTEIHTGPHHMAASTQPLAGVVFQNTTSTELDGVWPLPFWKDTIDSSSNYQNFLCWGANYASKQELASTADLNSVSHRDPFTASGFASPLAASFPNGKKHFPGAHVNNLLADDAQLLKVAGGGTGWALGRLTPVILTTCHRGRHSIDVAVFLGLKDS